LGKIFDLKMEGKTIYKNISISLFIVATGLLFWSASTCVMAFSLSGGDPNSALPALQYFVYSIIFAILIALVGIKYSVSNQNSENGKENKEGRSEKFA
jgi:putative membrane protein